ncbi:hypothetical protein [Roseateles chitosanitabidus]|jgi:hypothetical protein|uniref:hypothetical protein n=1 Tax=Roseateles chitosanitabidus TaxID=65048 RepID=UPI0008311453|nr:hypothetical protein [Roseateles chitosanitabidus]MBO9687750.1 hypothetical protein [Roseateles chitosanitabidus]
MTHDELEIDPGLPVRRNFGQVIRQGLERAHEAESERQQIARLFATLNNALLKETGGKVELYFDKDDCESFDDPQGDVMLTTRIVLRSVTNPARGTVVARGEPARDGGLPYHLSLNYVALYCDLDALEEHLCEVMGSALAGKAIRDLMLL